MKTLKRIGTFIAMLLTAGRSAYKIREAFAYIRDPEYYEAQQGAYRERHKR